LIRVSQELGNCTFYPISAPLLPFRPENNTNVGLHAEFVYLCFDTKKKPKMSSRPELKVGLLSFSYGFHDPVSDG
jgi:hypothetical protein